MSSQHDAWTAGHSYEHYMGRWSRVIAWRFLEWLDPPERRDWLEIGCGTGALTATILAKCDPASILATDQSDDFVRHAADTMHDERVRFETAEARALPVGDASVDIVTSGLVLNFIPDKPAALQEMRRVLRPGGLVAFYVWDYPGGGMGFIDAFWRAAAACDPAAASLDEGKRFPFCTAEGLKGLCEEAGLADIAVTPLEVTTRFDDFNAFWRPFTLGAGPAPGYCRNLEEPQREALKHKLAEEVGTDGAIELPARAWAARGTIG
ncbi:SAM-dependent methyltransferase [Acuticoccus sediminis]|uniref:SAM-dependent methyltransferase n=1 Tax=Acuticoccus sediminis TaxID=2184697 RepID=A0A8B2P483_9HYPH|nr:class I SAM-dependent methyltransferase [Acuticoccus sediminis]RAI03932.1 SAM-dependent methyltransferase [Acuticoccus sediminis]